MNIHTQWRVVKVLILLCFCVACVEGFVVHQQRKRLDHIVEMMKAYDEKPENP